MNALTDLDKKMIADAYSASTVEKLSQKYHVSSERIKKIIRESGMEIRVPTKPKEVKEWDYKTEVLKKFPSHEGLHYIAISKDENKKEFDDYLNTSGALSSYIKNNFKVEIPSLFLRKKYFHENGKQWYEQYFDIIEVIVQKKEVKVCPYCGWETVDIYNKSGMFETHLLKEHGITKIQYLEEHPEDKEYFSLVNKTLNRKMETDESKFVCCAICGEKFARLDWRHLAKHGITKLEYIRKYGFNTISEELKNNLCRHMVEVNKNMKPTFVSKPESAITEFIKSFGIICENNNRTILDGKELDIYLPDLKFAIEYNGNFWHSDDVIDKNKHLKKTELCKSKGVKLIQIFEDEFFNKRDIVFNKIKHIVSIEQSLPKIAGRKCEIREISADIAKGFLELYHIQGFSGSKIYLGAFYEDKLVAVMTFKEEVKNSGKWELTRFASDYNYICQGIGGKLFKYFIKNYNPEEIKSFADRRWTVDEENNIYIKLGFRFDKYTEPDYKYYSPKIDRYRRFHKFNFRKQIISKKYGLPLSMTESEMAESLKLKKIWNCGLIKYVWKRDNT